MSKSAAQLLYAPVLVSFISDPIKNGKTPRKAKIQHKFQLFLAQFLEPTDPKNMVRWGQMRSGPSVYMPLGRPHA